MSIKIRNGNINNIKNLTLSIPHNRFVVVTGVSGSGKSSLIKDILEREGRYRFFDNLSSYQKSYLGNLSSTKTEIDGMRAVISIDQKGVGENLRSTAGTLTSISDLLRLLVARAGRYKDGDIKLQRGYFSNSSSLGRCESCMGIGEEEYVDIEKIVEDDSRSLRDRALKITLKDGYTIYSQVTIDVLDRVCRSEGFDVDTPLRDLSDEQKNIVFYGSERIKIPFGKHTLESRMGWSGITAKPREEGFYRGIIPVMSEILKRDRNPNILKFCSSKPCNKCSGTGLGNIGRESLYRGVTFPELISFSFKKLHKLLIEIKDLSPVEKRVIEKIIGKIKWLLKLGLGYLTPSRSTATLSGGEIQRLRIARIMDIDLSGITYLFDEPSIGLHYCDNSDLINCFRSLVKRGNSVIVVEHNRETITKSDYLIEFGVGAGYRGGDIIYQGYTKDYISERSQLYPRLSGGLDFKPIDRRGKGSFKIFGAKYNNLNGVDIELKHESLNIITGVSGSGKTTLLKSIIYDYFDKGVRRFGSISNHKFSGMTFIDAKQPGRNSRSNPATYSGVFDEIRKVFGKLSNHFTPSDFSFNGGKGRCSQCLGRGEVEISLHFMENERVVCSECDGKRFIPDLLKVEYNGKNIYQVLELEIDEALEHFSDHSKISKRVSTLSKLGLGYLRLGQPTSTLSGGEAKRLKLANFIDQNRRNNLILMDEPTTGLSVYDVEILRRNLREIVEMGNMVVIIEHNPDLIVEADHIIDLGPSGGEDGGKVIFQGDLEELLNRSHSKTSKIFTTHFNDSGLDDLPKKGNEPIEIRGLKLGVKSEVDLSIKKGKITLIKGGEGSGSSTILDTIYNSATHQYLSLLSPYIHQFLSDNPPSHHRSITGLNPAITLSKESSHKDDTTVVQVSEIYDYYKLLYSRFSSGGVEGVEKNLSLFSFSHHSGACRGCSGRGLIDEIDIDRAVDFTKSIASGALGSSKPGQFFSDRYGQYYGTYLQVCKEWGVDSELPLEQLGREHLEITLFGTGDRTYQVDWSFKRGSRSGVYKFESVWKGFIPLIREDYLKNLRNKKVTQFLPIVKQVVCIQCNGFRLGYTPLSYNINGLNIGELAQKSFRDQLQFIKAVDIKGGDSLCKSIIERLEEIVDHQLGYIEGFRRINSLSSGEKQRLRMARLSKHSLRDIIYILDNPAKGFYYRDYHLVERLVKQLKSSGNSVIISDPKDRFINLADEVIELDNGKIIYNGSSKDYKKVSDQQHYRFPSNSSSFKVIGASKHNLKDIDIEFTYDTLNIIHGPSGSGKSTLLFEVLGKSLSGRLSGCREIIVPERFEPVIISKDFRSSKTIGNYLGFNQLLISKIVKENGLKKSKWSGKKINCLQCDGLGVVKGDLDFIEDIESVCDSCKGVGYNDTALSYRYRGYNLYQLQSMKIGDLVDIIVDKDFSSFNRVIDDLKLADRVKLNMRLNDLTSLERKLLSIVKAFYQKRECGKNLVIIDEPAASVSSKDLGDLLNSFRKIVENYNGTIIITEHDRDLISCGGNLIELGYGSGDEGGYLVK